MKTIKAIFTFLILSSSGFSQYTNVMISDLFSPNEPVIIMDSNQPGFLIAAANLNSYYINTFPKRQISLSSVEKILTPLTMLAAHSITRF